ALTGSFHTVPSIHALFQQHRCDRMAENLGRYGEEMAQVFRDPEQRESVLRWMARQNPETVPYTDGQCRYLGSCGNACCTTGRIILSEIHERAFRRATAFPFLSLIFHFCRESTITIWHCDRLVEGTKNVEVGLIQDYTYPVARVEVHQLQFLP
ncbi:hypothetical protein MTR67_043768, partial [Solanum verrucosum]